MRAVPSWSMAAGQIGFAGAMRPTVDLAQSEYRDLHRCGAGPKPMPVHDEFVIDRIGSSTVPEHADEGVEYYRYVR